MKTNQFIKENLLFKSLELEVTGKDRGYEYITVTISENEYAEEDERKYKLDAYATIAFGEHAGLGFSEFQIDEDFCFDQSENVMDFAETIANSLEIWLSDDHEKDVFVTVKEIQYIDISKLVQSLIDKIEKADTHKIFTISHTEDDCEVKISYEYNLHFAESVIGYNLEDWASEFPETYDLEGEIEITYDSETGEIEDISSTCEVSDCKDMRQQSVDYDGYQFDYQKPSGNVVEYLESFLSDVKYTSEKEESAIEEMEILFDEQTHPHGAYRNTYLKIGKKGEKYFYHESSNHVRHNENDYIGRSEWVSLDEFDEEHDERSIIEVFGGFFPELEKILADL